MEKLANNLAGEIARSLGYDEEKRAVVAYGLIAIIQIFVTVLLVLLLGIWIGAPAEALIACFSVSILRKYSGGAHAGTAELCTGIAVVYCTAAAYASKKLLEIYNLPFMLIASALIFSWSFYTVYRYAPVDSPKKPIRTEAKRARMKKDSLIVLSVYLAVLLILLAFGLQIKPFNAYGISLLFGVAWQILSLTSPGEFLLHSVNQLFGKEV